jgi:serine/threonine protein kinase
MPKTNAKNTAMGFNPEDFVGKKIGNCKIIEPINEGGTSTVYKAYNDKFELYRVVKILKSSVLDQQDFLLRFKQEAQLTARLDHPNILRVFDTGEVYGFFYIEMEFLEGQTLRDYIQKKPKIPERKVLSIGAQIADALMYAHNADITSPSNETIHGILHRDIKPENIMIAPDGTVKLMDFGAAKPLNLTSDTQQGMIVGTFHYMSPEQIKGKPLDNRSDYFSLGIVMYEMCTGVKPFSGKTVTDLVQNLSKGAYKSIRKLRPGITQMTEELIDTLLARRPAHRPKSAQEIKENVEIIIQTLNSWALGRSVKIPFSWRKFFPTFSLAFSLLALVVSIATFMLQFGSGGIDTSLLASGSASESIQNAREFIKKGKALEEKRRWADAIDMYEAVPSIEEGGRPNEYLEAQLRTARICFEHRNQLTKAKAILSKLKRHFSDPAIDAFLGRIYYKEALYMEAVERFERALNAKTASVIPQTDDFKNTMLYYHARALDRQYIYVDRERATLVEAIKAWDYYIENTACDSTQSSQRCTHAESRLKELTRIEENSGS